MAARRGVEVLTAQVDSSSAAAAGSSKKRGGGGSGEEAEARQQLCAALCALAEMTMAAASDPAEVIRETWGVLFGS